MKTFCAGLILSVLTSSASAVLITGSSTEFTSPDDLLFDAGRAVIAVDLFGNADSVVNGVTFFTDRDGLGAGVTSEGVVSSGGVTLFTTAVNQIDGWAASPAFTGGTPGSAANLGEIMSDIRWESAPNPLTVDITGLAPGSLYNVQLLFNEGADRGRVFDIGIDGSVVADNFTSEGDNGVWTPNNSFAYSGNFDPGADGVLNIALQQDLGGDFNNGVDGNVILQAVVIHTTAIPEPSSAVFLGLVTIGLIGQRLWKKKWRISSG